MSEKEADECAKYGEVLRWSSDSDEDKVSKAKNATVRGAGLGGLIFES